jgi:glucosyl-3-phosphoglycerate synthase
MIATMVVHSALQCKREQVRSGVAADLRRDTWRPAMVNDPSVSAPSLVFHHDAFDPAALAAAKQGRRVSVCLPARDEERTVGGIVASVMEALAQESGFGLVDEVVVVDDGSTDGTAAVARRAGARVVQTCSRGGGKGEAMQTGLAAADGDLVVFLDADVENFAPHFVIGMLGPLLVRDDILLVKGFYERPLNGEPNGGGRVTELVARPVINLLFPHLAPIRQPLAGESAAPREVIEKVGLAPGYGVEMALLIDVADRFGVESIGQVDLGVRVHRNRPLSELRHQATDVLHAALMRAPSELRPQAGLTEP